MAVDKLGDVKFVVVEGFDFTGKSFYINQLCETYGYTLWEPSFGSVLNNRVIDYSDRYTFNLCLLDLYENGYVKFPGKMIINRGLVSGIVYNHMYNQKVPTMNNPEFYKYARSKYSDNGLFHTIYISHENTNNAKKLYELSVKRDSNESYDQFEDFSDYYRTYKKFDSKFRETLDLICGDNYSILSSYDLNIVR